VQTVARPRYACSSRPQATGHYRGCCGFTAAATCSVRRRKMMQSVVSLLRASASLLRRSNIVWLLHIAFRFPFMTATRLEVARQPARGRSTRIAVGERVREAASPLRWLCWPTNVARSNSPFSCWRIRCLMIERQPKQHRRRELPIVEQRLEPLGLGVLYGTSPGSLEVTGLAAHQPTATSQDYPHLDRSGHVGSLL